MESEFVKLFFGLLLGFLLSGSAGSLRLTNMSVPAVIDFREKMLLDCQFDMGGEQLYAVKWYKDDNEFFRYMPHQQPHVISFPVYGVELVAESTKCGSGSCQVLLSNLLRVKSGGSYRCEVSSEAPAFRLASETHNVTVAAVPKDNPHIEGLDDSYFEGDILTAKCISSPSDPPQLISWFINKEQAPPKFVRDMKTSKPDAEGLMTTSQLIRFVVEQKYIQKTKNVELSCVAAFSDTPASARRTTRVVALYDHSANNPRYTYWYSSSSTYSASYGAVIAISLFIFLR